MVQTLPSEVDVAAAADAVHAVLLQLLLERHGGEVPGSFAELEALHGVGHKTASVVMSQAFGCAGFFKITG